MKDLKTLSCNTHQRTGGPSVHKPVSIPFLAMTPYTGWHEMEIITVRCHSRCVQSLYTRCHCMWPGLPPRPPPPPLHICKQGWEDLGQEHMMTLSLFCCNSIMHSCPGARLAMYENPPVSPDNVLMYSIFSTVVSNSCSHCGDVGATGTNLIRANALQPYAQV